jgi:HPt (histidine-containing phosphotransfer) domain-containing protein
MADSQKRLDSLQKAVLDGDLAMVVSQAHSIKGAAANLGAEVLQGTARRLETAARDGRTEACGPALEALQAAMLAFFEEVERLRGVS